MIPFPDKKYKIILADPPWKFKNYSDKTATKWVGDKYSLMSLDDIKMLPVTDIADNDSVLFLWTTFPALPRALEVVDAWEFQYKTIGFAWVKKNKVQDSLFWGMGYWTRSNIEVCLLATRGKPQRVHRGIHQVVQSGVQEHSKKPDEIRERIVQLMGDLPRIELFARDRREGWDAWGNEV